MIPNIGCTAPIGAVAASVIGVDSSAALPDESLRTGEHSMIVRGDGVNPTSDRIADDQIDIVVAGEFIEHIPSPIDLFRSMKARFPGRQLVISTPNGVTFANTLLGALGREVQHPDHVQVFTCKILNTLCERAGFAEWKIIPYRFYATEMILNSSGAKRAAAQAAQGTTRVVERLFPLLSFATSSTCGFELCASARQPDRAIIRA